MLNFNYSQIKQQKRRLKKNPHSREVHLNLGILYFKNKKYNKALEHLSEADAYSENNPAVKKMLAIVNYCTDNPEKAREIFLDIIREDPNDSEAYQYLSKIYAVENDFDKGIEFLKRASEIDHLNPEMWNDLGALHYSLYRLEEAEKYFIKAIETDANYSLAYINLMDIYLQQKRLKDAEELSVRYLEIFPEDQTGLKYHGMVCRLRGDFHEAIQYLSKARDKDEGDTEITYNLGLCFMSNGDFENAIDYFKKCVEINPDLTKAKEKLIACYCELEGANNALRVLKDHISDINWKTIRKEVRKKRGKRQKLSILVPAFNEANSILSNTKEIKKTISGLGFDIEILVVDDGSEDDTYDILELLSRSIKEIRPYKSRTNKGKGTALRDASLKAEGDLIVFLDADLELHPKLIPDLIRRMDEAGADVVLGSKRHPDSNLDYPWHRKVISNIYYLVNRLLFGLPVKDTQTGIKIFKKEVLDKIIPRLIEKRYAFDLELIVNVHAMGFKIIEAPITLNFSRKFGRIGSRAILRTAIDTLAVFYRLKMLRYYERRQLPLEDYKRVSIIVPFKKFNQNVQQCMDHCLGLDYPDFELILLPDHPLEITAYPFTRVIPTGEKPPSEKRDIGVRESTGEIIAFLDDDAYPAPDWLNKVVRNFSDMNVSAVGGPGVTPPDDNLFQQLSGAIFASVLVSGNYSYRYMPKTFQEIDDFPTCNLSVRKKDFLGAGGFNTQYWPGEDTILCLRIVKDLGKKIVYDPDAVVYHHRRELFLSHLKQIKNYALHRGFFVKKFPENSRKLAYFIPSIFTAGLIWGPILGIFFPPLLTLYALLMATYFTMTVSTQLLSFNPKRILLYTMGVFFTHITYGIYFVKGLLSSGLTR